MGARGEAVVATRNRILEAGRSLGLDDLVLDPTLEQVADRAGVSVQTVLRHFGTRGALLDAVAEHARHLVETERRPASTGPAAAVEAVLEHYERLGDFSLAMLAREGADDKAAAVTRAGKALHRRWVEQSFAVALPPEPAAREALVDLLVVATDVYAWKLLRRDRGLALPVVRERMLAMVHALLAAAG
jgi:AcrR family transcriptional regulator